MSLRQTASRLSKLTTALLAVGVIAIGFYLRSRATIISVTPSLNGHFEAVTMVRQSGKHFTTEVAIVDARELFATERAMLATPDFIADDNDDSVGRLEMNQLKVQPKWEDTNNYQLFIAYPNGARVLRQVDFDERNVTDILYGAVN